MLSKAFYWHDQRYDIQAQVTLQTILRDNLKNLNFFVSFIPNRGFDSRPKMVIPVNNLSTNKCSQIDPHTIYKESYICDVKPQRTIPILPKPNLSLPCGDSIDLKTIYEVMCFIEFPMCCNLKFSFSVIVSHILHL